MRTKCDFFGSRRANCRNANAAQLRTAFLFRLWQYRPRSPTNDNQSAGYEYKGKCENAIKTSVIFVTLLAKQAPEASTESASVTEHLDVMIRRIAMDSVTEIGRVIRDLENVSDMLRNEGERISREVNGYANLNRAATATMKVITESLKQWKERSSQNKEAAD